MSRTITGIFFDLKFMLPDAPMVTVTYVSRDDAGRESRPSRADLLDRDALDVWNASPEKRLDVVNGKIDAAEAALKEPGSLAARVTAATDADRVLREKLAAAAAVDVALAAKQAQVAALDTQLASKAQAVSAEPAKAVAP